MVGSMLKVFFKIAGLFFFISISACVTYTDETLKMRDQFEDKHYESALKSLDSSDLKKSKKNRFLYRAERAMILDRSGKLKESRENLFAADKVADELFTVSISKTAATFVYNESASDYAGEDYEKVGLHSILALSFLEENYYKSALVEARKINNKLYEITSQRKKSSTYKKDAFARFLSGLIREASGDYDSAIIDYRKAKSIMENLPYKNFYVGSLSTDLIRSLYGVLKIRGRNNLLKALKKEYPKIITKYEKKLKKTSGGGDLVVVHEVGKIAPKRSTREIR